MSEREPERCELCETACGESSVETATGSRFCSPGCRDIDAAFEAVPADDRSARLAAGANDSRSDDESDHSSTDDRDADDGTDDRERTFFRVDGMHTAQCEAFLESVAEAREGVTDAEASYVTETVRVDHDPTCVSIQDLEDALSTVGYTAYRREAATGGEGNDGASGGTRRSREMNGLRKRRTDDMLEARYVVGVVFGSFLLLPFLAILYPVYLSSVVDWGILSMYDEAFSSLDGLVFVPVFFVMTGIVVYLTGMPLLRGAYVSLQTRRPTTHLLASLTVLCAYAYGTIAFVFDRNEFYYDLAIVIAAVVTAAIFYEATVKRSAMDSLTELTISQVDEARLLESAESRAETERESAGRRHRSDRGSAEGRATSERESTGVAPEGALETEPAETVPIEALETGDRVLVRQGERIPVDGILTESACTVNESVLTGEPLPISKEDGDEVIGGSVVTNGAAVVEVGDRTTSSVDELTRTVWNAQSADHGVGRRADELAAKAGTIVLVAAVVVGLAALALGSVATAVLAVLTTVLVSSPWALGLAPPLSVASSVRQAVERGIVVFDETVFERLRDVDVVVFDKTGTLTTANMTVLEADAPDDLLAAVAAVERRASHPAGDAIASAFGESTRSDGGVAADRSAESPRVSDFRSHATGVEGTVDGRSVLVGHPTLFEDRGWPVDDAIETRADSAREAGHLPVVVGRDGVAEGVVVVGDEPRPDWEETITHLGERGLEVVILTGDDGSAAVFDEHPHVDHVFTGVAPAGKSAAVHRLRAGGDRRVAMVGDGTNDAPALAAVDLGISLGSGTALASDAADLAILEDDLQAVGTAFDLSEAAEKRLRQNLRLAGSYNAIAIPLAAGGVFNPLFATAAAALCSVLLVANCSRSLVD